MVVIRNVFHLKFGKAREAVALMNEAVAIHKRLATAAGLEIPVRVLTDLTGPFYTLVLELSVPSLSVFEQNAPRIMGDKDWQANYQQFQPLVDSGHREVYSVVTQG